MDADQTWQELRAVLHASGPVEHEAEDGRSLTIRRPVRRRGRRILAPVVVLSLTEVMDAPWIVFQAPICPPGDIPERAALRHNADLAAGALCLLEDGYALRLACPLATPDLELVLDLIAHEAARLRARVASQPGATLFDDYAD